MKSSLFKSMLCASILVFAVGCGKENKSGGGNRYSNLYNAGLTQTSQQVLQRAANWYNSTAEGVPQWGELTIIKTQRVYNTQPTCETKKFLGIPYQYCKLNGTPTTTELSRVDTMIVQDGKKISQKGNIELNNIFNGTNGTLVSAIDVPGGFKLDFLRNDGKMVSYVINTGFHSSLNPVAKVESSQTQVIEIVTTGI